MGNCASTSGALTVDPINEDSFKQNQTSPLSTEPSCRQSIISNSSGTDRNAGLDSYDHGKYKERMQLYEVSLAYSDLKDNVVIVLWPCLFYSRLTTFTQFKLNPAPHLSSTFCYPFFTCL